MIPSCWEMMSERFWCDHRQEIELIARLALVLFVLVHQGYIVFSSNIGWQLQREPIYDIEPKHHSLSLIHAWTIYCYCCTTWSHRWHPNLGRAAAQEHVHISSHLYESAACKQGVELRLVAAHVQFHSFQRRPTWSILSHASVTYRWFDLWRCDLAAQDARSSLYLSLWLRVTNKISLMREEYIWFLKFHSHARFL